MTTRAPIQLVGPVALQAAAAGPSRIEFLAYNGGKLPVEGFAYPVVVDLAGLRINSQTRPVLIDHDDSSDGILGQTTAIEADPSTGRIVAAGVVTGTSERAARVVQMAKAGHAWQASIGCVVEEQELVRPGDTVRVNGQSFVGPLIVARAARLNEISFVACGADDQTVARIAAKAKSAKAAAGDNAMDEAKFDEWVLSLGLDPASLTEEQRAGLEAAYVRLMKGDDEDAEKIATAAVKHVRARVAAEQKRLDRIAVLTASNPSIRDQAITEGWDENRTELAVLRASRPHAPGPISFGGESSMDATQVLKAGLLLRAGQERVALKAFGERNVEAARRQRVTNLVDLAAHSLRSEYRDVPHDREQMLRAAFSTTSLPNILSDVIGRTLIAAYEETAPSWRPFCYVASAEDFRTQRGIRPASIANIEQLGPSGEIKHGVIGEEAVYTWSVGTYAEMLRVTRTTIINDDLGFVGELAPMLGQAAGRSLADLIWQTIMANAGSFFSTGNGNLLEGTDTVLSGSSLARAIQAMRGQRDSKGVDISIAPHVLAVPPVLEFDARSLLESTEILPAEGGTTGNPVRGLIPNLVVEPRLENTIRKAPRGGSPFFPNASSTAWYLFGNPNTRPVTVGFLQGKSAPTVEMDDAPFDHLGKQMRVVFDYGVALSDPKAALKATGVAAVG